MKRAMIICSDILRLEYLRTFYSSYGYQIAWYDNEESYRAHLAECPPKMLIADLDGASPSHMATIRHAIGIYPELPVIAIGSDATARKAGLNADHKKFILVQSLHRLPLPRKHVA